MSKKDWTGDERKLQPVYDDIQAARHKPALAQVDRFLKKQPRSQPALILRACLLHKLGSSNEEVLKVWGLVETTGEFSGRTLWWSSLLMRNIGRTDILLALYQKLWEAKPDNAEVGQQVVLIAVARWDTPLICSSSRKMFNLLKTQTWARIAAWAEWIDKTSSIQNINPDGIFPPPAPENSLRIATTLLSTTRKKAPSSEILWLHVQILLGAGQEEAASALVREEGVGGGGIARNWWRIKTIQEVVKRMKARSEVEGNEELKGKLEEIVEAEILEFSGLLLDDTEMQRNWANYDHLLRLITACPTDGNVAGVGNLFMEIDEKISAKERAPTLAMLHLDQIMPKGRMNDEDYTDVIHKYWNVWGARGVIIQDIMGQSKDREEVLVEIMKQLSEKPYDDIDSYMVGKHARLLLLRLQAKTWKATEEEFSHTWAYYLEGRKHGVNLPDTDIRPADDIGLATVQVLLHLWSASSEGNRETYLFRAIVCLRQICEDSPSSINARYLLIRLYRLVGAPSLVPEILEQLKLAEIQLDTLLHIYTERASVDVPLSQARAVFDSYKERVEYMYHKTATDIPEYMKQALENESYASINSIRQLQITLATSLPSAMLAIESQRIALLTLSGSSLSEDIVSSELAHARDADEGEDTRSSELMPTLVGYQAMNEILSLGKGDWKRVGRWRDVYKALKVIARKEVQASDVNFDLKVEGLSDDLGPAERAVLSAMERLIQAALTAIRAGAEEPSKPAEVESSIADVIRYATAASNCRWEKLQSVMYLAELLGVFYVINTMISVTFLPKVKGKKDVRSSAILAFMEELKAVQAQIKERQTAVRDGSKGVDEADEGLNWVEMMKGSEVEDEKIERVKGEVLESRRGALEQLGHFLN